jgi:hypothetical protein
MSTHNIYFLPIIIPNEYETNLIPIYTYIDTSHINEDALLSTPFEFSWQAPVPLPKKIILSP